MYAQTYPSGSGSAHGTPGRGYPAGAVPASYQYGNSAYGAQPVGATYDGSGAGYGYPAGGYGAGANGYATPGADVPTSLVPTKDNRHYIELGMGAFVPTDRGNTAKAAIEANVWALHGGYVPGSGMYLTLDASTGFDIGCMAKSAGDGCKGHLRIHWIGTGAFINTGRPMIASDVSRSWDIMGLTGAEVRVWKGMTLKTTVNWFLPNPWGVYEHEKGKVQGDVSGAISSGAVTSPDAAAQATAEVNPADRVSSVLGHALRHPQINLMAMWEF
jgi:hypothetical protein